MLGDNLKRLRLQKELTQQQISEILKINRVTYTQYELNKREPDNATLSLFADFFGVTIDNLFGRSCQPAQVKCEPTTPQLSPEDLELLELARRLKNLPEKDRKEVHSYIQFKEHANSSDEDEQAAATMGK